MTHTWLGQIRVCPPLPGFDQYAHTSSVLNQTSLLRSQGEHCHQLYWTWREKEKERTPEWFRVLSHERRNWYCTLTLCSYSYHVSYTLKKKIKIREKKKRIKLMAYINRNFISSRYSLAQFSRVAQRAALLKTRRNFVAVTSQPFQMLVHWVKRFQLVITSAKLRIVW